MSAQIDTDSGDYACLTIPHGFENYEPSAFLKDLQALLKTDMSLLQVDLRGVDYIASADLGCLMTFCERAAAIDKAVKVILPASIAEVAYWVGLNLVAEIEEVETP